MDELFSQLETRIRSLIQKYDHQTESNAKLKQNKAELQIINEQLIVKHKTAISQLETLISRLKSLENPL